MKVSKLTDGAAITRWLDNRTVEVSFNGLITAGLIDQLLKDFIAETDSRLPLCILFDATQATGFNANARAGCSRFLTEFKVRGGREVLAVVSNLSLRMLGQALTFATGLPLKMFATREQALSYIVSKLRSG
jgi:hypothetical protein